MKRYILFAECVVPTPKGVHGENRTSRLRLSTYIGSPDISRLNRQKILDRFFVKRVLHRLNHRHQF